MAYNPQDGSLSAKPYAPSQGVPTDSRSYYYDSLIYKWRPYQSTAEVLSYLDTPAKRTGNFPIFIHSGTLNTATGVFTGGSITEYWFKDGVNNADLVVKQSELTPLPDDVDTVVQASGSAIGGVVSGTNTFVFSAFAGKKVRLYRNYQLQGIRTTDPAYYSFTAATGSFTVSPAPVTGESFQIQAYQ
jgi:hypothetical protein